MSVGSRSSRQSGLAPSSLAEAYQRGVRGQASEQVEAVESDRSRYAADPWAYHHDILGRRLTPQQGDILEAVLECDRVAIQAANNLGKTFLLAGMAVWFMDAVGSRVGSDGQKHGARLLLPGPSLGTVRATIWSEIMQQIEAARWRGHAVPGRQFNAVNLTKLWEVRPGWEVEALSPPKKPGEKQAHSAAGRHARNQWAIAEEGAGIPLALWNAMLGMCSGYGNKIITAWNPTERGSHVYQLTRGSGWKLFELSAMDHPNVVTRRAVIPAAISHLVIDGAVETECDEVGPVATVTPSPEHLDFIYALPPADAVEDEPRTDGIRGHRDGEPKVYRPRGQFAPRRLGKYPKDDTSGLFDAVAWDRATERWRAGTDPEVPPDRVGIDAAGEGRDEVTAAPSWGLDAAGLLDAWSTAVGAKDVERCAAMQATGRTRVGRIQVLAGTSGPAIAAEAMELFPRATWVAESTHDGKAVLDHAEHVMRKHDLVRWNPSGQPPPDHPFPEEILCDNERTVAYVRLAMLVLRGLVDVPDDAQLRQEIMAIELQWGKTRLIDGEVREVARVIPKRILKHRLGRSPDRADAVILTLAGPRATRRGFEVY